MVRALGRSQRGNDQVTTPQWVRVWRRCGCVYTVILMATQHPEIWLARSEILPRVVDGVIVGFVGCLLGQAAALFVAVLSRVAFQAFSALV